MVGCSPNRKMCSPVANWRSSWARNTCSVATASGSGVRRPVPPARIALRSSTKALTKASGRPAIRLLKPSGWPTNEAAAQNSVVSAHCAIANAAAARSAG